ncbi:MAG TPA: DUF4282 domain-containing protein [Pyrinomonadaceae bacterium]|nr:DUF4282 domain-containing protein [Pyrinomonadaceae bacterium]
MGSYFSFERMITPGFVKVVYFLGFIALTAAGVALAVWAGMQLNDATIDRMLGWRYVAVGIALVVIGNIVWRVFCELWVVLFGIYDELVSVRHGLNLYGLRTTTEEPIEVEEEIVRPREVVVHRPDPVAQHQGSVLGLS